MPCLLGSYAYQSSQPKHAVFSRISDFLLDIRSHYRRIVLGYIRIHKPLLSFLCHFTCFCIVFCFHCDCAVGVVCSGSWSVAFLWSGLVFPVCFFLVLSRHDHILPPINTCSFFVVVCCTTSPPFTVRRASQSSPQIYISHILPHHSIVNLHSFPSRLSYALCFLTRFLNIGFSAYV